MMFAAIAAAATVLTLAMPLLATDHAWQADEVGGARAREDPPARARTAGAGRKGRAARIAQAIHADGRSSNFNLNKWVGQEEARAEADAGRLSRPGALCHLSVLPHGHAGDRWSLVARSTCSSILELDKPAMVKLGIVPVRRLSRHAAAVDVPEEPDPEAAIVDPPRLPRRARPAADLRGIRHVDRGRVQAVSDEIGTQSIALAEELMLTTAELSYLQDRRRPTRISPSAPTSKACARSASRCSRRNATARRWRRPCACWRRKTATCAWRKPRRRPPALPPKLTVPMILFFLPVLFVVILGPAAIRVMAMQQ